MNVNPPKPFCLSKGDPYSWMKNKDDHRLIPYLIEENNYTNSVLSTVSGLRKTIVRELQDRVVETDISLPIKRGNYFYYVSMAEGNDYPVYARRLEDMTASEEVLLDLNVITVTEGLKFCDLGVFSVSPCHRYIAYSIDKSGDEQYTLYVLDTVSGEVLHDEVINGIAPEIEWLNDSSGFYYVSLGKASRPDRVMFHALYSQLKSDVCVYWEEDTSCWISLHKTKDNTYILLTVSSYDSSEIWYSSALRKSIDWKCVVSRSKNHEYTIEHWHGWWYLISNWYNRNYSLLRLQVGKDWKYHEIFLELDKNIIMEGVETFIDFLCVYTMYEGLVDIVVVPRSDLSSHYFLKRPEKIYSLGSLSNPNYESNKLIIHYSSFKNPGETIQYDLHDNVKTLLKKTSVIGVSSNKYHVERVYIKSYDGTIVPVTLFGTKDSLERGNRPCFLTGYGAYGEVVELGFHNSFISLVDRGIIYAFAHVRGGGEYGRHWYESGKLKNKKNSFYDFISVAEYLRHSKLIDGDNIIGYGASAGGLLIGAVLNQRPELFKAVIAEVPFVDVVNTIRDKNLPLTTFEYTEWGNPEDVAQMDYIRSYDPYSNIIKQKYPIVIGLSALHDSRVGYWEAAKWIAKLRANTTSYNPVLLRVEMNAGHSGVTGKSKIWDELASRLAICLWALEYKE